MKNGKMLTGVIVSAKTAKTAVVEVSRLIKHPKYGKFLTRSKRYLAHDEAGHQVGETVTIRETKPISKNKHFIIV